MRLPEVVSREEWLAARRALLAREKELTRARDRLVADRRRLPMVRIDTPYELHGPDGSVSLAEMFDGYQQLIVQHFMFDPEWDDGCPSCTAAADEMSAGLQAHLHNRNTHFVAVSRAPSAKLERYKAQRGWHFPWYSSFGTSFNYDFGATIDSSVTPVRFNFLTLPELEARGLGWMRDGSHEQPGYSTFLRVDENVFHTYSTFARGTEQLGGSYYFLDMTALGRQEEWEEPKGRVDAARRSRPDFTS